MSVPAHAGGRDGTRDDVSTSTHIRTYHLRKGFDVAVTIKPLEDRILVEPLEAEQTTASGLVIPDTAKEKPQEGKVLATGPGRVDDNGNRVPLDVSEGDVVIFSKYGGTEVKYDGKELLLLNARDILAVVTK
jgi:chaperonin GroES